MKSVTNQFLTNDSDSCMIDVKKVLMCGCDHVFFKILRIVGNCGCKDSKNLDIVAEIEVVDCFLKP